MEMRKPTAWVACKHSSANEAENAISFLDESRRVTGKSIILFSALTSVFPVTFASGITGHLSAIILVIAAQWNCLVCARLGRKHRVAYPCKHCVIRVVLQTLHHLPSNFPNHALPLLLLRKSFVEHGTDECRVRPCFQSIFVLQSWLPLREVLEMNLYWCVVLNFRR